MTNDNPTLIAGFEDVMTHIRNQEKRIQELEKENNRLNNEIIWEWNEKLIALKGTIQEFEEKNSVLEGTMKRYSDANMDLKQQKQELEAKVDEAQVIFKENLKYKKEIETIQNSIENECEASGIMEIMNTRIEDAEKQAREQEILKVIAEKELEREHAMNKCHVEQINRLHDILRDQCDKDCCQYCDEWVNSTEIEEVKDSDFENVYVCMDCLQGSFTQCDDCMEYCCDSLILLQNGRQICSNCSG